MLNIHNFRSCIHIHNFRSCIHLCKWLAIQRDNAITQKVHKLKVWQSLDLCRRLADQCIYGGEDVLTSFLEQLPLNSFHVATLGA